MSQPQPSSLRLRGINAPGQRHANRAAVLEAVFRHGPVDQTALGRLTGLSGGSISRIVGELAEDGLLRAATSATASQGLGRPRVPLDLNVEGTVVLSMHVGAHLASVGAHTPRGQLIAHRDVELEPGVGLAQTGERLFGLLRELVSQEVADAQVLGTGIGVAAQVGTAGPAHEHPTLKVIGQQLADLGAALGYGPVHVDSLMYGLASAESWFGRFAGPGSLGLVHIGNTVGSAVVVEDVSGRDQAILEGRLGHLRRPGGTRPCSCGRQGCFQAEITDDVTAQRCRQALGKLAQRGRHSESIDVVTAAYELAKDGNDAAHGVLDEWAAGVADAVAVLLAVADVERVLLIGRTVTRCAELLVPLVNAHLDLPTPAPVEVEVGSFGEFPALTSAAALVLRRVFGMGSTQ